MKLVVKTLIIHLLCVVFFAFFYYRFSTHFNNKFKYDKHESTLDIIIDFFLFSTTIQAGVGIS